MKHMNLSLQDMDKLQKVAHALSNNVRLRILEVLDERSMNVLELSQRLNLPISTVSNSITVLKEADLIRTEQQAGVRGVSKLCSRKKDTIAIDLHHVVHSGLESFHYEMPIGHYSDCAIMPVCGLLDQNANIGEHDDVASFYDPRHTEAQMLWFHQGYVEYRFTNQALKDHKPVCMEFCFEACSEAPNYRLDWPSDITVSVNDIRLGTWRCPGDFGGRQGRFTPLWWLPSSTQYGILTRWRVDETGSFLNGERISDVCLNDLHLTDKPYIALKIGILPDAEHVGGINLFGEKFGDYNQAIIMRMDCLKIEDDQSGGNRYA